MLGLKGDQSHNSGRLLPMVVKKRSREKDKYGDVQAWRREFTVCALLDEVPPGRVSRAGSICCFCLRGVKFLGTREAEGLPTALDSLDAKAKNLQAEAKRQAGDLERSKLELGDTLADQKRRWEQLMPSL